MQTSIDRRSFISAAALAAASLGVTGTAFAAESSAPAAATASAAAETTAAPAAEGAPVELHRAYGAAHGDKCFTQAVVAVADGVIVAADVDDYQFMDKAGNACVPNSDGEFGQGVADATKGLASKSDNHVAYTAHMAEKAGATTDWLDSMDAIEEFAKGKTPEELADIAQQGVDGTIGVDTIAGCTLVDAFGYLGLIAQAAADEELVSTGVYSGDATTLKMGRANTAAHGTKSFCDVVTLTQDDVICAASIDEFQFMDPTTDGVVAVPNADGAFGEAFADGVTLVSKSQSNAPYSALMAQIAGATQEWLVSMQAVEAAVAGVPAVNTPGLGVDTISGSTLTSTTSYAASCGIAAYKGE